MKEIQIHLRKGRRPNKDSSAKWMLLWTLSGFLTIFFPSNSFLLWIRPSKANNSKTSAFTLLIIPSPSIFSLLDQDQYLDKMANPDLRSLWIWKLKTHGMTPDTALYTLHELWWQLSFYQWTVTLVTLLTAGYFVIAVRRLFFHPLSKFPGPRVAAITRWYEFYYDVIEGGTFFKKYLGLHKKYSKYLRLVWRRELLYPVIDNDTIKTHP